MNDPSGKALHLPPAADIRGAVAVYLEHAWPAGVPDNIRALLPPDDFDPAQWLMSSATERDPADAPLAGVRSFAIRLGNAAYPHMKLRLSRPPGERLYVLSVDSHDAFLAAPAGSADSEALAELKRTNAEIAAAVAAAWDDAGLDTERSYLRGKIRQARDRADSEAPGEDHSSETNT